MKRIKLTLIILFMTTLSHITNAQNKDLLTLIEYATKAPSGHNTQPWKFKIHQDSIEIIPDYSKTLPFVDPNNRELFISLGCATENLCIAASALGYASEVQIRYDSCIIVNLIKTDCTAPDRLFEQIDKRQTNRSIYEYRIVSDSILKKCISSIQPETEIAIHCWESGSQEYNQIKEYILMGNMQQMDDKEFVSELKEWMRYNKNESESNRDGLSYDVFGAPNLPVFISKPIMGSYLNSKKQNKSDSKKIDSSSHFVLLTSRNDNIEEWIATGRYMERLLLRLTQEGVANAYMNQPCEINDLRQSLQQTMNIDNQIPQILLRIGYAIKAPYSRRKNIEDVIIMQ